MKLTIPEKIIIFSMLLLYIGCAYRIVDRKLCEARWENTPTKSAYYRGICMIEIKKDIWIYEKDKKK